ncbi:K00627 pyruvate dehydrogenase E2 component (dihydrolipoamide acetyltransferase) [Cyberlindnera jadinii]|uniref:Ribonuclease n=1 Tax=Cyberlindnera jadinii (strain ATCC 18201 / CBS 1600 / BCRC 20928 / JCM 3617 / NBRC 0987 / NRRL Y-1542) TaxID=983966 RepID=A0A0H5C920_CYBJN|nr:K00627 pyruvate dehydrogenase E2 component (dihydrolipoamide acetyltransferase) [Cyberlindnera jadinii]
MTQGNLAVWNKAVGDQLSPGEAIAEVETDKAQMDFEFQEDGYLAKILVPAGSKDIPVNTPIAVYVEEKGDVDAFKDFTVYVDTVGPPMSYQAKLQKRFPQLKITVAKKADALYPVVSAASICAKVTRDFSLLWTKKELYGDCHDDVQWGSGYPSDPKTKKWLVEDVDKLFGWGSVVRFSWGTAKEALIGQNCYKLEWEEDNTKFDYDVTKMGKADVELNMEWYSKSCVYF